MGDRLGAQPVDPAFPSVTVGAHQGVQGGHAGIAARQRQSGMNQALAEAIDNFVDRLALQTTGIEPRMDRHWVERIVAARQRRPIIGLGHLWTEARESRRDCQALRRRLEKRDD